MLKDVRGKAVSAGDRLLLTRHGELKIAVLIKETSENFILSDKMRLPKTAIRYSPGKRWHKADISDEPYKAILKVGDNFSL